MKMRTTNPKWSDYMKHILKFGLIIAAVLIFASCRLGSADITHAEAAEILTRLLPYAEELNEAFLGRGLEPSEPQDERLSSAAKYVKVSGNCKYQTVGELASAAETIFSEEYCTILFEAAFYGSDNFTARYSEAEDGTLQVNVNDQGYNLRTKLFPDGAVVKNKYDGKTAVSVPAEFDGTPCEPIIIYLVYENGSWLIDSPTY